MLPFISKLPVPLMLAIAAPALAAEATKELLGSNERIQEAFDRYCIECHDSDTEEGEVNFDHFLTTVEAKMNPKCRQSL